MGNEPAAAPKVSIILPTLNRGSIIGDCLESIIAQTYSDWELIVCDDASTDNTAEIVAKFSRRDARIRYLQNPSHLGLPATRNEGIRSAKAPLVLFTEDDVTLETSCIGILVGTYEKLCRGYLVGAVAPSVVEPTDAKTSSSLSLLDYGWRRGNRYLTSPCKISAWTGLVHYNFRPSFTETVEVPSVHACSLYSAQALRQIGGYAATTFKGNYLYEESDVNLRLGASGHRLFFEPKAVMYHTSAPAGGCRTDILRYGYYFILNHSKFVVRNFGARAIWMLPAFVLSLSYVAVRSLFALAFAGLGQHGPAS